MVAQAVGSRVCTACCRKLCLREVAGLPHQLCGPGQVTLTSASGSLNMK